MIVAILCLSAFIVLLAPLAISRLRRAPTAALSLFLYVSLVIPYWIGISAQGQFIPLTLMASAVLLLILLPGSKLAPSRFDSMFLGLLLITGISVPVGGSSGPQFVALGLAWAVPYALGRVLANRLSANLLSNCFVPVAVILSVWAIVELVWNWHPFVALTQLGGPWDVWASVQYRAGLPRSEAALGHSIVLGNILALTIPFVMASSVGMRFKVVVVMLITVGIFCTFSRMALVSLTLALALSLVSLRPDITLEKRLSRGTAIGLAAAIAAGAYLGTMTDIAGGELENSTLYRAGYQALIPSLVPLGPATSTVALKSGGIGYASSEHVNGVATSVDSSVLLVGLQFGWVPMTVFGVLLVIFAAHAVRAPQYSNPALLSAVALIPGIASVAMITQLPYIYWMTVGLAAGLSSTASSTRNGHPSSLQFTKRAKDLA